MLPEEQVQQVKSLREEVVELRRRLLVARDEVQRLRESPLLQCRDAHAHSVANRRLAKAVNRLSEEERSAMRRLLESAQRAAGKRLHLAEELNKRASSGHTRSAQPASPANAAAPLASPRSPSRTPLTAAQQHQQPVALKRTPTPSRQSPTREVPQEERVAPAQSGRKRNRSSSATSHNKIYGTTMLSQSRERRRPMVDIYLSDKNHLNTILTQAGEALRLNADQRVAAAPEPSGDPGKTASGSPVRARSRPQTPSGIKCTRDNPHAEGERGTSPSTVPAGATTGTDLTSEADVKELLKKAYSHGLVSLDMLQLARLHAVVRSVAREMYTRGECSATHDEASGKLAEEMAREEAAGKLPPPRIPSSNASPTRVPTPPHNQRPSRRPRRSLTQPQEVPVAIALPRDHQR